MCTRRYVVVDVVVFKSVSRHVHLKQNLLHCVRPIFSSFFVCYNTYLSIYLVPSLFVSIYFAHAYTCLLTHFYLFRFARQLFNSSLENMTWKARWLQEELAMNHYQMKRALTRCPCVFHYSAEQNLVSDGYPSLCPYIPCLNPVCKNLSSDDPSILYGYLSCRL